MTAGKVARAFLSVFFLSGCGYIGDPLPPLANIPSQVKDLAAVQRGARIIVQFTPPQRTTEGIAIKDPLRFDLRVGVVAASVDAGIWSAAARRIPESALPYSIPSAEWTGKEVAIAVNIIGSNGKESGWSNFANVPVVVPPPMPESVRAEPTAQGVRLTWQGPSGEFRVFRRTGDEANFTRLAVVTANEWLDAGTEFGKPYRYLVQRTVKLDATREAESEPSAEVTIVPRDTFPPAVPASVRASGGVESIELSWDASPDSDLAGYRIYRAVGKGGLEKLAEAGPIPAYSDRAVERGKTYRYAVTAIDQTGNESQRSAVVEGAFQ